MIPKPNAPGEYLEMTKRPKKAKNSDFFENLESPKRVDGSAACQTAHFLPPAREISGQANQPFRPIFASGFFFLILKFGYDSETRI